jgi:hypothetical protein
MPSLSALFLGLGLTTLLQLSAAAPTPAGVAVDCTLPIQRTTTPTLPLSGDAVELPSPNANLTLQYVAIGRGIQNYTCASTTATPSSIGAIATLFDATALAYLDEAMLHTIPGIIVNMPLPSTSTLVLPSILRADVLGHHYFDAALTPTFDLSSVGKILFGGKTGDIKAPSTASKGPAGTGAVDWLQLTAKSTYVSEGLSLAYRVETAGGVGLSCNTSTSTTAVQSVQYAAEYWFYF